MVGSQPPPLPQNMLVLPRLVITAPGEDSGKRTLAAMCSHLGDTMDHLTDPTAAVIFSSIEASSAA